jgi:hypothetical protein
MDGSLAYMELTENVYKIVRKPEAERQRPLGRPKHR